MKLGIEPELMFMKEEDRERPNRRGRRKVERMRLGFGYADDLVVSLTFLT